MQKDYIPVQTLDLEGERKISFDLFLNLPVNGRVILYRRKGDALDSDKLSRLIDGNVTNFWIKKEDYNEFVKYVAQRLKALIEVPGQNEVKNREMVLSAAKSILSSTFSSDDSAVTHALMGNLNQITSVLIEAVLENISPVRVKSFRRLMEIAEQGSDFHKHPVNVTSLAVLITFGIGYNTDKILTEVATGALLHDVGLAKLPSKISSHAHEPMLLSIEDRRELYRHGEYALDILREKNIQVSEVIRAIVTQHHEQFNGFGYPLRLRGYVINEFAQIVKVADELDDLVRNGTQNAETLRKCLEKLFDRYTEEKVIEPDLALRIRKLFLAS